MYWNSSSVLRGGEGRVQRHLKLRAIVVVGQHHLGGPTAHQVGIGGQQFAGHAVFLHALGLGHLFLLDGQLFEGALLRRLKRPAEGRCTLGQSVAAVPLVVQGVQRRGQAVLRLLPGPGQAEKREGQRVPGYAGLLHIQLRVIHLGQDP